MNPLVLTSMAAISTLIGGYCAIRLRSSIHLLMAFGAGVMVGAACLDLLPGALSTAALHGWPKRFVLLFAAAGGLLFFFIDLAVDRGAKRGSKKRAAGRASAALLIFHSAFDGTTIVAAATVSLKIGLIVGLGIVAHDLCDGLNTVLLSTSGGKAEWKDYGFLALDALAPIAGGLIAARLFSISAGLVMAFLSFAAGSFLFIATAELFPEAYRIRRHISIPAVSLCGFAFVWMLTRGLGSLA